MTEDEILASAHFIAERTPCGTIVLQGGETPGYTDLEIGRLIRRLATETPLAITLSIGNRPRDVYARWRDAGLHRYLLRFETADPDLFRRIHPDCTLEERLRCLRDLKALGIQTGSGFMVGIPGETPGILAENLLLCREMDFDMAGIGPFIPTPDTPMGGMPNIYRDDPSMPFRAYALLRLLLPRTHIPATTAMDAFQPQGRWKALQLGANVYMPNMTPLKYRNSYLLYPNKPGVELTPEETLARALSRLAAMHRPTAPLTRVGDTR